MIWVVRCKVDGVRDAPVDPVGSYRWRWLADLAAFRRFIGASSRRCVVIPVEESDWHPWRRGGRWVERRRLAPWFSVDGDVGEQIRRRSPSGGPLEDQHGALASCMIAKTPNAT